MFSVWKNARGFTLIELMIVVAIIAVLAAIAVPNLIENRMQANETNAVAALKQYASAQFTYQKANYGSNNGLVAHSYCNDFCRLGGPTAHTKTSNEKLELIPEVFASAINANNGFQGYYFTNDQNIAANLWTFHFGLYADPCMYSKTGINSFYVSAAGTVKQKDFGGAGSGGNAVIDTTWVVP